MSEPGGSSWWAVVGWPAVAASVPGAIALWQWYGNLKDKKASRDQTTAEKREAVLLGERKALAAEQRDILAWVEKERDRLLEEVRHLRLERRTLERDRDRGWNLARFHHRLACELRHALNGARLIADGLAARSKPPVPQEAWKAFEVPDDMEAPFPRGDVPEERARGA